MNVYYHHKGIDSLHFMRVQAFKFIYKFFSFHFTVLGHAVLILITMRVFGFIQKYE